jgi:hypothetical protein
MVRQGHMRGKCTSHKIMVEVKISSCCVCDNEKEKRDALLSINASFGT